MTSEAPERHNDTERNKALNLAVTKLDVIINRHDPEIDVPINDGVWNALDQLCHSLETAAEQRGYARGIEAAGSTQERDMADLYDETDYFGTPESRDRDARMVGHEAGPDRLGGMSLDAVTHVLTALRKSLYSEGAKRNSEVIAINTVLRMIPHLPAERNTLEAQVEGSLTILAQERTEVLKLREQLAKVEEVLKDALKYNTAMHGGAGAYNKRIKDTIAALAEQEGDND